MIGKRALVRGMAGVVTAVALTFGGLIPGAVANPETPVKYPAGSSATRVDRLGFDTCTAPSLNALRAWYGPSPYKVVNTYFGGRNRGCKQPNLTSTWVHRVHSMGWRLLPTFVGYQPYCQFGDKEYRFTASNASSRGAADGADAIAKAKTLAIRPGSALYADIEHYDRSIGSCRAAVRRYVSAWTTTLHRAGYLAGVYVHQNSGLRDLAATYESTSYARPDAVWMARWDGRTALFGWPRVPDAYWAEWQRAKQYRGDHNETWGGVKINIDSDRIEAPVATVARNYKVTSKTSLNARTGPSTSYSIARRYASGASLQVVCQSSGQLIGTSRVWDRLTNGAWVSDYYVSTPSRTGFSSALPRCTYPGQVTASSLNARTGPGISYAKKGSPLPSGALAYVICQAKGGEVNGTTVWNRLRDGRWVSDYYVSNRSNSTWSAPVPRCP